MKNLSLKYCLQIFRRYDYEMYVYLQGYNEKALNMKEVSGYARDLRDYNNLKI